ncbi:MAG: DNA cytosine methyltransferase [Candidatus Pacebacteria bacterium]|nr:DNA cytosine methyltransferase [Candidatus Paceibacterota bacterium]
MADKKLKVVDLFSGCGGLSKGFIDAGFDVLLGVDNDKAALETFRVNHNGAKALDIDLFAKNAVDEIKKAAGSAVDVIVAGPPCQGFSLTGTRNFDDKRNRLYLSVIEAVNKLKPKAFLIENVPGLARLYGGAVKDEIINRLSKSGYNVSMKILTAADYGVPQVRTRVVFVGLQKKYGTFEFPAPTNSPADYVSCESAIGDLPALDMELGVEESEYDGVAKTDYQRRMRRGAKKLYNHVATKHTDLVKSVISLVPEGGNHKDLPPGVGTSRKFNEAWTRYHSKKPSRTIDTGHRNHFHYKYNRIPTVRENARLQSFPDNFRFLGTRTEQNRQVGNAVPPLLGYHIGRQILRYLNEKRYAKKKSKN